MPLIMNLCSDLWPSRSSVFLLLCVGSMCLVHVLVTGTSVQSYQHLLKHPHYADDGHQHARHVGTTRSRNTRLEETQGESTPFPVISFTRSTGTTRAPRTTPTDYPQRSIVNSRIHYSTSRSSVTESDHKTNFPHARELPISASVTAPPLTVQNRPSSGPLSTSAPAVHSEAAVVTFPPQDYYNVNISPEGSHKPRKHSESNEPPTKPKMTKEIESVRQANQHFLLMRDEGRCKVPRPQVVQVKDFYPDPTKEYLPRCTLLHRCSDHTGCCDTEGFQCMPKVMQEVALTFYVIFTGKDSPPDVAESVTKLLFVNHTECECLPLDNLPRAVEKPPKTQDDDHHHHVDTNTIENHPSKCRGCPRPFFRREYPDGRCACDCFDRQRPCLRIKRGRESMQESERRCVETGRCHIPDCEYGSFDALLGRCPRKPEDHQRRNNNNNNNNQKNNQNQHHRWTFYERD